MKPQLQGQFRISALTPRREPRSAKVDNRLAAMEEPHPTLMMIHPGLSCCQKKVSVSINRHSIFVKNHVPNRFLSFRPSPSAIFSARRPGSFARLLVGRGRLDTLEKTPRTVNVGGETRALPMEKRPAEQELEELGSRTGIL